MMFGGPVGCIAAVVGVAWLSWTLIHLVVLRWILLVILRLLHTLGMLLAPAFGAGELVVGLDSSSWWLTLCRRVFHLESAQLLRVMV